MDFRSKIIYIFKIIIFATQNPKCSAAWAVTRAMWKGTGQRWLSSGSPCGKLASNPSDLPSGASGPRTSGKPGNPPSIRLCPLAVKKRIMMPTELLTRFFSR